MLDKLQQSKNARQMGNKKDQPKSRRQFFSSLMGNKKEEKIKLLTADGKLVEVDRSVLEAGQRKKVNNQEILAWMQNPSKG